jgi:hypothetical protein
MLAGRRSTFVMAFALAGAAVVCLGAPVQAAGATIIKCVGTAAITGPETGKITHDKRTETYKFAPTDFRVWKDDEQVWSENICARKQTNCTPVAGEFHVTTVDPGKDLTRNDIFAITQGYRLVEHRIETSDGSNIQFSGRCATAPDPSAGG